MSNVGRSKNTLCWDCAKAIGDCTWSASLIPVKGWTAVKDSFHTSNSEYETYLVIDCPEFVPDKVRGGQESD